MISKKHLIQAYGQWLKQYRWNLFGSLTFAGFPSRQKAQETFDLWIAEVQIEAGTRNFRFVQVTERGVSGDNIHFHFLIGGLRKNWDQRMGTWCKRWQHKAGAAVMGKYKPKKPGIFYLLKTLLPDRDFDVNIKLPEHFPSKESE
jgi:hypothetical protein